MKVEINKDGIKFTAEDEKEIQNLNRVERELKDTQNP